MTARPRRLGADKNREETTEEEEDDLRAHRENMLDSELMGESNEENERVSDFNCNLTGAEAFKFDKFALYFLSGKLVLLELLRK